MLRVRGLVSLFLVCILASGVFAGWNDIVYSSPTDGANFRQGGNLTLTLHLDNAGVHDGGAAYVSSITLLPGACINHGESITVGGSIVCPNSTTDQSCAFRFRNSALKDSYSFENLSTDESCQNGEYRYSFILAGSTEVGAGGSFSSVGRNASPQFRITFIGPHFCGDGSCEEWKHESCETCPSDCGRCAECTPSDRRCINDSVADCDSSGFWDYTQCIGGCAYNATDEPECLPPCTNGEQQCVAENILSSCVDHKWQNWSCSFGCLYNDCRGNCETSGCPESCAGSSHLFNGTCSNVTGKCTYVSEFCPNGCDPGNVVCSGQIPPTPTQTPVGGGGIFDLLLPLAVFLVIAVAVAVIYLKFVKRKSPP